MSDETKINREIRQTWPLRVAGKETCERKELTGIQEAGIRGHDSAVGLRRVHNGLIEDDLMLMLRRIMMGLLLLLLLLVMLLRLRVMLRMMMVGQVVVLPLRRHAHRRRGPPSCELSLDACDFTRFALIGT